MARKKVVSIRLDEERVRDLERTARRLGRTPSQTAAMLVDEGLRRERFPLIEMRDTAAGRIAYIKGTRLSVPFIVDVVRGGETPAELAEDLDVQVESIRQALAYAEVFHDEVDAAIAHAREFEADPRRFVPGIMILQPDAAAS